MRNGSGMLQWVSQPPKQRCRGGTKTCCTTTRVSPYWLWPSASFRLLTCLWTSWGNAGARGGQRRKEKREISYSQTQHSFYQWICNSDKLNRSDGRNEPRRSNQDPSENQLNRVYFAIVTEWMYMTTYQMNKCMEIKWLIIQACVLYNKNWPVNQNKMFV